MHEWMMTNLRGTSAGAVRCDRYNRRHNARSCSTISTRIEQCVLTPHGEYQCCIALLLLALGIPSVNEFRALGRLRVTMTEWRYESVSISKWSVAGGVSWLITSSSITTIEPLTVDAAAVVGVDIIDDNGDGDGDGDDTISWPIPTCCNNRCTRSMQATPVTTRTRRSSE
jgi:hypothetical protein